ncbi:Hsp33 family molecular chaperone HslO [Halomonas sabkhae]|uniref:Hsp33 family molecular chaperone HslO n=1 Tax=Halomonas sabkhae TaxID=626223 RepID=UPI0025B4FC4D|nr:Hsp33 family molecular chaperone HslO [Halomonas sabkhae]MDN3526221.1 Hsp33 family molecular chaperone HslO [Halomonas sabkhae]
MTDQIQRFLFDNTNVRGEVVSLQQAYAEVVERHDYPPAVTRQLGELLSAVALLTETIKLNGTMSIEVRGKGALSLLMAESNPGGELRAIAQLDENAAIPDENAGFAELLGEGQITITLDPDEGRRYQGIVTLEQDNLAGCLEDYFSRSEQLPTRLWLAADDQRCAGVMLQRLPDESLNQDEDAWERMVHLADTLKSDEMLTLEHHELLHRLFHEEQVRVFDPKALYFSCNCSRERISSALLTLGEEELRDILAEQGGIATQCHFCNTRYEFTAAEVDAMLEDPSAEPPTVH